MDKHYCYGNTLYHHGIKGQKWGVRRFQNADGTYTSAGKERRRKEDSYSDDYKNYKKLSKKNPKELSTKELEEINRRDNAMSQYNRNHVTTGKVFVNKLSSKVLEKSAEALAVAIVAAGSAYVKHKLGK